MASLLRSIAAEFDVAMGRPEKVAAECARVRERLRDASSEAAAALVLDLASVLRKRGGEIALPLHAFLAERVEAVAEPWPLLGGMLAARDGALVVRTLDQAVRLAEAGTIPVDRNAALLLAGRVEVEESPLARPEALRQIARILRRLPRSGDRSSDPVLNAFLTESDVGLRRLAGRILTLDEHPVPRETAEQALGSDAHAFLAPYLAYTRAGYLDLIDLVPEPGSPPPALDALRRAEAVCGESLLRLVIAELGWSRVNLDVEARSLVGVSVRGSLPLMVSPEEESLFASCEEARRVSGFHVIVAHGGLPAAEKKDPCGEDVIARFRAYNLTHASVLADILDVAPLTAEKVRRIVEHMDSIVDDFVGLFGAHSEDCTVVTGVYRELRDRIVSELEEERSSEPMSAELTRLVQAFEDPDSIGAVRTLHGLKRYLHQRGLRLGFRLVETGRSTNRTVDLVLLSRGRLLRSVRAIRYVDFEPDPEESATHQVPYPIDVVVDGFVRQLLSGQQTFPAIRVFCYGNEVHYYLHFGTHPAFVRVDFSPPLQGGMIDLEYFGVSKAELTAHPNPSLPAISVFFRRLEFDAQVENTHIHARYDKERAIDLADLCEKAEALFRLAPYLMEVDWVIGDLDLDADARLRVAEAWAESFALWGVLPVAQLLTRDRRSIVEAVESGPAGDVEIRWNGEGPYRDRFTVQPPGEFFARLREALERWGLDVAPLPEEDGHRPVGQIRLERGLLGPLREAVMRGELIAGPHGFRLADPELFRREHEVEKFVEILDAQAESIQASAGVARLVAPLERLVRFRTTGDINGHEVQRGRLRLRGERIGLYVLRGPRGIARLAFCARGGALHRRRRDRRSPWRSSASCDVAALSSLLRRANYLSPEFALESVGQERAEETRARFRQRNPTRLPSPAPGERTVAGFKASPGRAVGKAVFGTGGRSPQEFRGAVLVAPCVRPEDSTFLFQSAGIVSTGGGVLSHAGLIALQFRKPSLIVSGRWQGEADGTVTLICPAVEYRQEETVAGPYRIAVRRSMLEREYRIRERDLLVLDADAGALQVLGQDRDALALHEGFCLLGEASRRLAVAKSEDEILSLRGRRLRARHQIEKLFRRLADPVLARHAVKELLIGEILRLDAGGLDEKPRLLSLVLGNSLVAGAARECLARVIGEMAIRASALRSRVEERIPRSDSVAEILSSRAEFLSVARAMEGAISTARGCGTEPPPTERMDAAEMDSLAHRRLAVLREAQYRSVREAVGAPGIPALRHRLRQLDRLDLVLGTGSQGAASLDEIRGRLATEDVAAQQRCRWRRVLGPEDGGFELWSLVGWKAANLAEVGRLAGGCLVPPWFAVTDRALEELLNAPVERVAERVVDSNPRPVTLQEAIVGILVRPGTDDAQKAARIRALWEGVRLPPSLAEEVLTAYRRLGESVLPGQASEDGSRPFVAIRSSAREEDAETAARAGEFDTFLFVRGDEPLLDHLKMAWSGLWTERAIHNRAALGADPRRIGGGLVVQRIVWSRVSGVLQTVNAAEGEFRQIVINAGLGLGEGIVSGAVAADQIIVAKEGDLEKGPLRFRYVTADKRERVVFDERRGLGTVRTETLYHQRLRPALEYVELLDLVRVAVRLENDYGYPLDIEFAIEGTKLWILQVRPVATFLTALRDALERYPLAGAETNPARVPSEERLK